MYSLLMTLSLLAFDLGSIKNEPNLERRSELALAYANTALDQAREAYDAGDVAKTEAALGELRESVELAYQSLEETGKDARRNPKFFKRAELKTRELMRRLDGLRSTVGFEDRPLVEKVRDRVAEVHDDLLKGIMSKKK
jgi:hypothetical protein